MQTPFAAGLSFWISLKPSSSYITIMLFLRVACYIYIYIIQYSYKYGYSTTHPHGTSVSPEQPQLLGQNLVVLKQCLNTLRSRYCWVLLPLYCYTAIACYYDNKDHDEHLRYTAAAAATTTTTTTTTTGTTVDPYLQVARSGLVEHVSFCKEYL